MPQQGADLSKQHLLLTSPPTRGDGKTSRLLGGWRLRGAPTFRRARRSGRTGSEFPAWLLGFPRRASGGGYAPADVTADAPRDDPGPDQCPAGRERASWSQPNKPTPQRPKGDTVNEYVLEMNQPPNVGGPGRRACVIRTHAGVKAGEPSISETRSRLR